MGSSLLPGFIVPKRGYLKRSTPDGPVSATSPGPLFSSLLVHQPTSLEQLATVNPQKAPHWSDDLEVDHTPHPYDRYLPPLHDDEKRFRHAHWLERRSKVIAALRKSGASAQRIERVEKCGSDCVVEVNQDGTKARLRANYCGDRFCDPCCRARGKRFFNALMSVIGQQEVKFFTFTRRDDGRDLIKSLDHLREAWVRIRQQNIWTKNVRASAYVVEITRGESGDGWHVHIHMIAIANWVSQADWVSSWKEATGGSTGVWISATHNTARDVGYVCKYATKGIDPAICEDHESTVEAIVALRARRLIAFTGEWFNLDISQNYRTTDIWKPVGRFVAVADASRRNQPWALGIFRMLGRGLDGSRVDKSGSG